jgi:glutathione S-transferase
VPSVKLFGLKRSVYTRAVRLALEEKGVRYTLHEVDVFGPNGVPPEHFSRHPFGRIPSLEHDGFSLYETAAISRYVDEAFPGPALQSSEARARARMNQITGVLDSYAYRPMVWGVFVERISVPLEGDTPDEAKVAESSAAANTSLAALTELVECEPFLLGQQLTLADLHAFPILRYFSMTPEGRELLAEYSALNQWLARMLSRPSVQRTMTTYETLLQRSKPSTSGNPG